MVSDNNGACKYSLFTDVETSPTVNEMLELERPLGIFRLVDNEQVNFSIVVEYTNITLSFEEVLY